MSSALSGSWLVVRRWADAPAFWSALSVLVLLAALLASAALGAVSLEPSALWSAMTHGDHALHGILWDVRIPRLVAAALVGSALAVSGALMQTAVRNPLAEPGLLGVTAGAGLGALVGILFLPGREAWLPGLAFLGGMGGLSFVLFASWTGVSAAGPLRLILSGVGLQAILASCISLLIFFYADRAPAFVAFVVGSLNGAGWTDVGMVWLPVAVGIGLALGSARSLDVLGMDDDSAASVGLPVQRTRVFACALAALLAASAVSVAGRVGFVGLVVPNALRIAVGPGHARLLPLSAAGGATLVVCADLVARTLVAPLELPVGALLALVGGPFLLYLLWTRVP